MVRNLEKLQKYLVLAALIIFPSITAPFFIDTTNLPKIIFLAIVVSLFVAVYAIKTITNGKIKFNFGKLDLYVLLVVAIYLISSLTKTPNKMEAFFVPGTASTLLVASLMYFLCNQIDSKRHIATAIYAGGVLFAILTIFVFIGLFPNSTFIPDYLTVLIFLSPQAVLGSFLLISEKEIAKQILTIVSLGLIIIASIISFSKVLPGTISTQLPTFETSKVVALDTLKTTALLGAGPGNYLTSFNLFRPISYNQSALWQIRFTTARDFYLTALTETGILGLISILMLIGATAYYFAKKRLQSGYFISCMLLFLLLAIFPTTPFTTILLFILLSLNSKVYLNILSSRNKTPLIVFAIFLACLILFVGLKAWPVIEAESDFRLAFDALNKNEGKKTYDLLKSATSLNPYVDRYRASSAQVDFALAQSISQKKDLSEADKQTISQLIQDAIKEGQATVTLNPNRADNWSILAQIYQRIIPSDKNARSLAKESYTQAINFDPLNPNLRIALGGIYFEEKKFDDAINIFQLAVLVKPDFANSHYNLAAAYREKGDIQKAIDEMKIVLSLVTPNSNDYKLSKNELDSLEKKITIPSNTIQGENLTNPINATTSSGILLNKWQKQY